MSIVSDAGPLIALGKLGIVDVPFQLYGRIVISRAVYIEVVSRGDALGAPDAKQTELAIARKQIKVVIVDERTIPVALRLPELSNADRQTVWLAQQEKADWVLIDEFLARQIAKRFGLKVKGTLGIILEAFRKTLLSGEECLFLLQSILRDEEIWIDENLVRQVQEAIQKEMRGGSSIGN